MEKLLNYYLERRNRTVIIIITCLSQYIWKEIKNKILNFFNFISMKFKIIIVSNFSNLL